VNRARALALATALALLAAAPDSAATGALAQLSHLAGKPATGLTFSPIGATPQPLAVLGKPTVVIAFASWCFACMDEMPRNLADYAKYKDRVTFLGIDYLDGDRGSRATIEKYAIPFPIERDGTANPPPAGAAQAKSIFMMALPGVTPKELPGMANTLKSVLATCAATFNA